MADKHDLLAKLRSEWTREGRPLISRLLSEEEVYRKGAKAEVALGAKMKKGGEAVLRGASAPKGAKAGTPFPLPVHTEILCKSGDK